MSDFVAKNEIIVAGFVLIQDKVYVHVQSVRVVKAYEYYQTCIATKTFEFFGFLSEARNDTQNLTACCTNVPNLILLKIGHLCSSLFSSFPIAYDF